ncbi:extracellular solute-binding protein [Musicola paradisiaca]|uniref:Extracellular solute-binding protein family 1 n=1 Tax=Musicola paradisiaca (strain Ech703) TaxID=579405 RepID=C6CA43_MUSP7|nr:extracellular solute-binding protein [Musicola paradisiaca]ACS84518.1 extracellular solute-binding protein family 1 [Musicola paradisiaca Ech703]
MKITIKYQLAAVVLAALVGSSAVLAQDKIQLTYAGSMGVVMDKALGPTFAHKENLTYQGQGQGAYGMARLLASKKVVADVFVSITPGPMQILKDAGLIDDAVPVASTRMVIAYNPKSPFAAKLAASDAAKDSNWLTVLQDKSLKFGRTDPYNDPQGQNIIFTLLLAEKYYHQPDAAKKVLGEVQNPAQVFMEGGLLTRLESGQIDATSGYESAVRSAKLPYVTLPDEINLSNPTMSTQWYDTVSFTIKDSAGKDQVLHTQPLVFYAAVLKNAPNAKEGRKFIDFMLSQEGRGLFSQNGYDVPKGSALYAGK